MSTRISTLPVEESNGIQTLDQASRVDTNQHMFWHRNACNTDLLFVANDNAK
jgi:hypothetical protein